MQIVELTPAYAAAAARLHIAGQPGTFLTDLGPDVLCAIYTALPNLPAGFGYLALSPAAKSINEADSNHFRNVLGFVSATTGVGRLFVEMGWRQSGRLAPPLLSRFAQRPGLIWRSMQTALYPMLVHDPAPPDRSGATPALSAELLSIMVEPGARGQGVGSLLLQTLVQACADRGIHHLDVTVDELNQGAQRFYRRHGFVLCRSFHLYGRTMCLYQLDVERQDVVESDPAGDRQELLLPGSEEGSRAAGPLRP